MSNEWQAGRLDSDLSEAGFDTLAVRAGQRRSPEGEHGEALCMTSSYVFRSAADAAVRFSGEVAGNVYSRYTNPTVRTFEERMAALEAESARLESLGAQRLRRTDPEPPMETGFIVMADPEGNEFCVLSSRDR